jgi:type 1 fimbria pilin
VWNIQLDNGANLAAGAQMESFNIVRTSGPKCAPSVVGPAFPVSLGDIAPNGSATTPVTIDFTGCSNATKFKANIHLSSNDGVSNTTVVKNNQTP